MRAVRFAGVGRPAQIADVPKPSPGPGQIVIKIHAEITEFPLEQAVAVYERLKAGEITGRAVLVP